MLIGTEQRQFHSPPALDQDVGRDTLPLQTQPGKYRKEFASQQKEVQQQLCKGPLDILEMTLAGRRIDLFSSVLSHTWLFYSLLHALSPPFPPQPFHL